MFLAFFVLATLPAAVPARWASADVKSLELLRDSPVNCLLLEQSFWSAEFAEAASKRGVSIFGVIRPGSDAFEAARRAAGLHFAGAVLEGQFEPGIDGRLRKFLADSKMQIVEVTLRSQMRLDGVDPIAATDQGLWPGIRQEVDESKAAPSGGPWIDTNTGFLRFVRASTKAAVWMANPPPEGKAIPIERYLQAIGDAAMTGARWVVTLDKQMMARLLAREPGAIAGWKRINETLKFYEEHPEWRNAEPFAELALVEDSDSGALLSGGILDMIAVKHTPVRPVPRKQLSESLIGGAKLAVNVDTASLTSGQRDVLRAFTRSGGTLLSGPPGWKFPLPAQGQITLEQEDLKKLDEIWKELNSLTGRKNLGARLFNVSSMLSNLVEMPDRKQVILHLVNYSDYPVENVAVHVLGSYHSAVLLRPATEPVPLNGYAVEDGTGFDIPVVPSVAALLLTR
jgi:hypothetical protein